MPQEIKNYIARRYDTLESVRIQVQGEKIIAVEPCCAPSEAPYVGPGFLIFR